MRKSTAFLCSAAAGVLAIGFANAELTPMKDFVVKQTKRSIPAGFTQMNLNGEKIVAADAAKGPDKVVSQSQTSTILFEDFSNVPDGEFVQTGKIGLRAVTPIANYDCGKFMNPEYTPQSGQWYGEWVYAGTGGTVIIQNYNPMAHGCLHLPIGDYSGDLIVTMRLRARKAFWGADNEVGFVTAASVGTDMNYYATVGGLGSYSAANSELGQYAHFCKIYENDGWVEVRTTFRNESANSDGSIMFYCPDACEIDWIKVEDAGTHLAAPVSEGITDFQENQFSIKWGQVRRAFNYYIDFFYAKWLADSGVNESYDFEAGIPEGFTAGEAEVAEGLGYGESNAVRVADGEENALVSPEYVSLLENASLKFMYVQVDDIDTEDESKFPALCIDGLTEEGWRPITEAVIDGWWYRGNVYMAGDLPSEVFAKQYKALRFHSKNTDDENYFVIDDLSVYAPRPYELARVVDPDPSHEHFQNNYEDYLPYIEAGVMTEEEVLEELESPFNSWWNTEQKDPCEYTFSECVEADKEYFYRLRSHRLEIDERGNTFTGTEIHHALGVAAPQLEDAVDVKAGSYTAKWKDAAKAQNFIVSNYEAIEVEEDTPDFQIFNEAFSKLEGSSTYDLYEPVTGEVDTDMPGWEGEEVTMGENGLGCAFGGILISPEIGVVTNEGKPYYVYFEAEGMVGETLIVQFNGLQTYAMVPFEQEDGTIAGTIEVNEPVEGESISFYTYNGYPFAIKALEVTQDVAKGSQVRVFDSYQIVPAGVQKAVFSGLKDEAKYAYKVVSHYQFEKEQVRSMPNSLYNLVDLKSGSTTQISKVDSLGENVEVVARYTVDGLVAPEGYKGLVIEKLSNGQTRKAVVR